MKVDPKRPVPNPEVPYSPGPWTIERFEGGTHKYCQRSIVSAGDFGAVAELHYSDSGYLGDPAADVRKTVQLANACLIAAAPDLLQMLRDVDAHFAAHFGEQAWATSEIGGMTRVSIAKATGGVA